MKTACLAAALHGRCCARLVCSAVLFGCSSLPAQAWMYGDGIPVDRARYGYAYPYDACYYHGRCTADDLRRLRDRLQRMDRVTPQPPGSDTPVLTQRADVPPTAVDQIRPEFREASQLREEYRAKADEGGEPEARSGKPNVQSEDQSRKDSGNRDY